MKKPNIIYILADDMGYGDISSLNENGKIHTPNIDRIINEGMHFTDAHSTSAVCSPSRYGILTGRYNWRTLSKGIVEELGNTIVPQSRKTIANICKDCGYTTAIFGKWHLGMNWQRYDDGEVDYTKPVLAGPTTNGFDYYFGVDVPNWPPYSFIENKQTVGIPTKREIFPHKISNEEASLEGATVDNWDFKKILPTITDKACEFIDSNANKEKPFFIYFPLTSPHTPLAVNDEYIGKSGLNHLYADFVIETDAMIGKVLQALNSNNITEDTLVVFASDNGFAGYIGADHLVSLGHYPSYQSRGYKADAWDGGHHIPLAMRWPKMIKENTSYKHLVSLSDFFATVAEIIGYEISDSMGEDSLSMLNILKGDTAPYRNDMVQHSLTGKFAIRKDNFKLVLCAGSGGYEWFINTYPSDKQALQDNLPRYQLYDLKVDIGEKNNLIHKYPEKAKELLLLLQQYVENGRSTDGIIQKNDIKVLLDPETVHGEVILDDL